MKDISSTPPPGFKVTAEHAQPPQPAIIPSRALLGQSNVITIEHEGMRYTLRATRNGKLILTK
ncbi:hemin uptake protein HemP [Uliginosibacterium gangwonense]|uniref:hemin uptake protein HemP n=1 Tax=Uliginosibacterium gangwonense TaxID=392736 RepID=UPI0003773104|nr:hemin uptake protein HemP [Uliginosibacterium gangwonense]